MIHKIAICFIIPNTQRRYFLNCGHRASPEAPVLRAFVHATEFIDGKVGFSWRARQSFNTTGRQPPQAALAWDDLFLVDLAVQRGAGAVGLVRLASLRHTGS